MKPPPTDPGPTQVEPVSRWPIAAALSRFSRSGLGFGGLKSVGTPVFRRVWVLPILAVVALGVAGWWVNDSIESSVREQRALELNAIADGTVTAVAEWIRQEKINVGLIAADNDVPEETEKLLALADGAPNPGLALAGSDPHARLKALLARKMKISGHEGYLLVSADGRVLSADVDASIGVGLKGGLGRLFQSARNDPVVSPPFRNPVPCLDSEGDLRVDLPGMYSIGPVRNKSGTIAMLGLLLRPETSFTKIFHTVERTETQGVEGRTLETYPFNREGVMLTRSRFEEQLKKVGLLNDKEHASSMLTIEIRDPGADLASGERPAARRSEQPFTRVVEAALEAAKDGKPGGEIARGDDTEGYRGYRGRIKVGAWRWVPDFGFGVVSEVDLDETLQPLRPLRRALWILFGLLGASLIGMFLATVLIERQQRALASATLAAKHLGQYSLGAMLGKGGMGTVYQARHAMLRRPTAIKLLNIERTSESAVARFEREVQLTSSLTHPNTVAVFDYGRTPEGIFYYVMEYLDGMNLDDLVGKFGPLPEARVVHILRQVCGSLAEAHAAGMVHRDIKPANIFLTRRGGVRDFVKVLDFGLAKALEGPDKLNLTSVDAVVGTPLYLSPEALHQSGSVDARADVYAVGAVAYYLVTGAHVFDGKALYDIFVKHTTVVPDLPSARLGRPVHPSLEALIMRCLAKRPDDRPANAAELLRELDSCKLDEVWDAAEADRWWTENHILLDTIASIRRPVFEEAQGGLTTM